MFDNLDGVRFARMSSGTWCLVRDLGLVKGGKGIRHFQPIVSFSVKGLRDFLRDPPGRNDPPPRDGTDQENPRVSEPPPRANMSHCRIVDDGFVDFA